MTETVRPGILKTVINMLRVFMKKLDSNKKQADNVSRETKILRKKSKRNGRVKKHK